jgi:K+-transporting ATPase c subunit
MRVALVSLLMLFFVAGHAFAATVNATSGQVFLSSGEGYRKVVGSTQAGQAPAWSSIRAAPDRSSTRMGA